MPVPSTGTMARTVPIEAAEPSDDAPPMRTGHGLHPVLENRTRVVAEALLLADERSAPVLTVVVKGSFDIRDGTCALADEQARVLVDGELWDGDPATSSYKFEPETAFTKPATDIVLIGTAHARSSGTTESTVALRVGAYEKRAVVFGDRVWVQVGRDIFPTKPRTFEKVPLRWERAFGGWDRSHPDQTRHTCEPRNPVGVGHRSNLAFEEGIPLPNVEDPAHTLRSFGQPVTPVGFGFVSSHWQPRASLAGTYDDAWQKTRAPLLPKDFDRRHFNAAPPGLVARGFLQGNEDVVVAGVTPSAGDLRFQLPAVRAPNAHAFFRAGGGEKLTTQLDTVIVDADARKLYLLWRAFLPLETGPFDVHAIRVVNGSA